MKIKIKTGYPVFDKFALTILVTKIFSEKHSAANKTKVPPQIFFGLKVSGL